MVSPPEQFIHTLQVGHFATSNFNLQLLSHLLHIQCSIFSQQTPTHIPLQPTVLLELIFVSLEYF
jgi:hypothetical protein